jgi:hypothetical protein
MKINFPDYVNSLGTERYRAIIIHHSSYRELEKFARSAEKKLGGYNFNLLEYFKKHPEIQVDEFDVEELETLLIRISKGKQIIYINQSNFLLDTWSNKEKETFYGLIDKTWSSYVQGKEAILVFFIQTYEDLMGINIKDTKSNSRIHTLSSFINIE